MAEQKVKPFSPKQEQDAEKYMRIMSRIQAWVFKKTGGRFFKTFFFLAPVGILYSKGRKSGQWREACLVYGKSDDSIVLIGSKAGCSTHPLWYLNLKTNPECRFQVSTEIVDMIAREVDGDEKRELWQQMLSVYKGFNSYKARADGASGREIPLIILEKGE